MENLKQVHYVLLNKIPDFLVEKEGQPIRPRSPFSIASENGFLNLFLRERSI
jgi:hypothetical protein